MKPATTRHDDPPAEVSSSNSLRAPQPRFVDLGELVRDGLPQEVPQVAAVMDGKCLLYKGRINEVHAEPAVGKTNIACAFVVAVVKAGGTALFLDPEDTPQGIAGKLSSFGLSAEELSASVRYIHNPGPEDYASAQAWARSNKCTLVVCDGLAEALAAEGYNEDVPMDVLTFFHTRMRPFAETGSSVLVSDHVAKNAETRGRWARGSGAKMGRYDGVSYGVTLGESYRPNKAGFVRLVVSKDRLGGVGILHQSVAELHFTPEGGQTRLDWRGPRDQEAWRPTELMAKIVQHLKQSPSTSKTALRKLGKAEYVDQAIEFMKIDGVMREIPGGPGKPTSYKLLKPDA